jgi:2-polyprenyl-6-methoxyphenol hydroxylase-like FAD-dependent oxidoreductase
MSFASNRTAYMQNIHVVIAGAGLGGLCLAQGLKKKGISFDIFEKDPARNSRTQGYRIRIDKTGQQALQDCLPESLFQLFKKTCAIPSERVRTLDPQLGTLDDKWIEGWTDGITEEDADWKADRLIMRELLFSGIGEQVHFNKPLIRYEELPDGSILSFFADGSTCLSDVLVGADGAGSVLRQQRFPGTDLTDTGSICIYGKTFLHKDAGNQIDRELQTCTTVIFGNHLASVIDPMQFRERPAGLAANGISYLPADYIYWALIGRRDSFKVSLDYKRHSLVLEREALRDCIDKVTTGWPAPLKMIFDCSDPETVAMVPVRTSGHREPWIASMVTALGDAVHTMSPAAGLGANSALYDAGILAEQLGDVITNDKSLPQAIGDYEQKMCEHSFASIRASQEGGSKLFGQQE